MTPIAWLLVIGLALVVTYEIYAAIRTSDSPPTISQIVWRVSAKNPIVPFLAGLLAGHLFA